MNKEAKLIEKTKAKLFLIFLKYLPIVSTLLLMLHTIILMVGVDDLILDHIGRLSPVSFVFMISASKVFRFCWVHRLFIMYNLMISIELEYHEEIGFTYTLLTHRIGALIIGTILFIILIHHFRGKILMKISSNSRNLFRT